MLSSLLQSVLTFVASLALLAVAAVPHAFGQEQGSGRRATQTQAAQSGASEAGESSAAVEDDPPTGDMPDASPEPLRQRIIDPRELPANRDSLFARVALGPFRRLAPRINSGLTRLENQQGLGQLSLMLSNPFIHPTFGGLGDGSGFGAGVYLSTADRLSKNYKLFFSTHGTTKAYTETLAGAEFAPQSFAGGRLRFDVVARHRLRPQENFWGLGMNSSRGDRTTYGLTESGIRAESSVRVARRLKIGALIDYSTSTVTDGRNRRFATISERFNTDITPGFGSRTALVGAGLFAEYEGRDEPGNPHAGYYARFAATSNDSIGRGDFGFVNYSLDARAYVPLATKRRLLAFRLLGDFNDAKGNSLVPLQHLARLGGSDTLRGYDTHRFHARHAVHATIEYRYQIASTFAKDGSSGIDAVAFTDAGQVFDRHSEFSFKNVRATWGGGLQFSSKRSTVFRILYARSPEGSRVFFTFGPTF